MLLCSETGDCGWCRWTHRWGMRMAKWQGGRGSCCKWILVRILKNISCQKYIISAFLARLAFAGSPELLKVQSEDEVLMVYLTNWFSPTGRFAEKSCSGGEAGRFSRCRWSERSPRVLAHHLQTCGYAGRNAAGRITSPLYLRKKNVYIAVKLKFWTCFSKHPVFRFGVIFYVFLFFLLMLFF